MRHLLCSWFWRINSGSKKVWQVPGYALTTLAHFESNKLSVFTWFHADMNYRMPRPGGGGNTFNVNPNTHWDAVFDNTLLRSHQAILWAGLIKKKGNINFETEKNILPWWCNSSATHDDTFRSVAIEASPSKQPLFLFLQIWASYLPHDFTIFNWPGYSLVFYSYCWMRLLWWRASNCKTALEKMNAAVLDLSSVI